MTPTLRIALQFAALWVYTLAYPVIAQPSPQVSLEHWEPLQIKFGNDVRGIYLDRNGLMEVENFNDQDQRAYPAVSVLVDLAKEKNAGILGGYQSIIELVALDCIGKRAQNIQTRLYAQQAGVERTAIMGVLSMWNWEPESYAHPAIANELFQRFCETKGNEPPN